MFTKQKKNLLFEIDYVSNSKKRDFYIQYEIK
jgi:hypothetical protein